MGRKRSDVCATPGCGKPKAVSSSGFRYAYCAEHRNARKRGDISPADTEQNGKRFAVVGGDMRTIQLVTVLSAGTMRLKQDEAYASVINGLRAAGWIVCIEEGIAP